MKLLKLFFAFWGIAFIFWGFLTIFLDIVSLNFGVMPLKQTHSLFLLFLSILYVAISLLYKKHYVSTKKTVLFVLVLCCLFGLFAYFQCYPLSQIPKYLFGISTLKIKYILYNMPALWLFLGHICITSIILQKIKR